MVGPGLVILDEAAAGLKNGGRFAAPLSPADVHALVIAGIDRALAENRQVRARVLGLTVQIADAEGTIFGGVQILKPLSATVHPRLALGNDQHPSRIRLLDLHMETEAGFVAGGLLRVLNLEGRARSLLADPNQALASVLGPELHMRGATLTGLGLHFNSGALVAQLQGTPRQE